jgi:tetratricopeptide (TPR) repeat protein
MNRANSYEKLGLYDQALDDHNRVIELEPASARAYYNRGNVDLAQEREREAFADYSRAIELDPTLVDAYVNVGIMFARREAWAEALPYLEQATALGDSHAAQYAAQTRRKLGMSSADPGATINNAIDLFLDKFFEADTLAKMRQATEQYPLMTNPQLLSAVTDIITQQAPPELRPEFEQRLVWLQQIANE